jgi:hypothetical protein
MVKYQYRKRLQTKLKIRNKQLSTSNRWFASNKFCNNCNYHCEMSLKDRICGYFNYCTNHYIGINVANSLEKLAIIFILLACEIANDVETFGSQRSSTSHFMLKDYFTRL